MFKIPGISYTALQITSTDSFEQLLPWFIKQRSEAANNVSWYMNSEGRNIFTFSGVKVQYSSHAIWRHHGIAHIKAALANLLVGTVYTGQIDIQVNADEYEKGGIRDLIRGFVDELTEIYVHTTAWGMIIRCRHHYDDSNVTWPVHSSADISSIGGVAKDGDIIDLREAGDIVKCYHDCLTHYKNFKPGPKEGLLKIC